VDDFIVDDLGTVVGLAVTIWWIGFVFRWYNRWHFRRNGNFRDGNMDQSYLRNFLNKPHDFTPPGIKELNDEGFPDTKSTEEKLKKVNKLSKVIRATLKEVLQKQLEKNAKLQTPTVQKGTEHERKSRRVS